MSTVHPKSRVIEHTGTKAQQWAEAHHEPLQAVTAAYATENRLLAWLADGSRVEMEWADLSGEQCRAWAGLRMFFLQADAEVYVERSLIPPEDMPKPSKATAAQAERLVIKELADGAEWIVALGMQGGRQYEHPIIRLDGQGVRMVCSVHATFTHLKHITESPDADEYLSRVADGHEHVRAMEAGR